MFRIVCDPSSGSTELCLTEITLGVSQLFFVCLVGEPPRVISLQHRSVLPDDGSHTIRNMLE